MSESTIVTNCWVLRIEDSNGVGPFRSHIKMDSSVAWAMLSAHIPMRDLRQEFSVLVGLNVGRHYSEFICVYHTIEHLKKYWDQQLLNKVLDKGFTVKKIFVKECWLTDHQCIFLKENIVKKQKVAI